MPVGALRAPPAVCQWDARRAPTVTVETIPRPGRVRDKTHGAKPDPRARTETRVPAPRCRPEQLLVSRWTSRSISSPAMRRSERSGRSRTATDHRGPPLPLVTQRLRQRASECVASTSRSQPPICCQCEAQTWLISRTADQDSPQPGDALGSVCNFTRTAALYHFTGE